MADMTRDALLEAVARAIVSVGTRSPAQQVRAALAAIEAEGFAIVPNANNMTDEQAEAMVELVPMCGGMAHSVYHAALKAAGHDDYARPGAGGKDGEG